MIEEGEYVRTKRGIAKVLEVKTVKTKMYGKHDVAYLIDKCPRMYITETEFIKHSKNIIDLIEVGDILEIELSEEFVEKEDKKILTQIGEVYTKETLQKDIDNGIITKILTILTKEQYMQNCYKLVDRPADS